MKRLALDVALVAAELALWLLWAITLVAIGFSVSWWAAAGMFGSLAVGWVLRDLDKARRLQ